MTNPDRLYELLPILYRERDANEGYPLRALMRIIGEQAALVERDIETLYDDLFIETCRNWVIPYIGDLVSNRLLFDSSRLSPSTTAAELFRDLISTDLRPPVAIRTRADVAKTIYYRRRKGTLPMLEELARDVTGYPAHAVEYFELLGWTQFREHFRPQSQWAEVRSVDRMDRVNGAFDETSHTVDVRRIARQEGRHNIHNVGFHLFRLGGYLLKNVPARQASAPWRYHFSPLGHPAPLFSRWRREGDAAGLATELHVPAPIRRPFWFEDLKRYRALAPAPQRPDFTDLYGLPDPLPGFTTGVNPESSFFILRNGAPVEPSQNPAAPPAVYQPQIVCRQLDPWPAAQPVGRIIAVDVETGRLAVGDGWPDATDAIDVFYHYGFSADLGGGPYERQKWLVRPDLADLRLTVEEGTPGGTPLQYASVTDAINDWNGPLGRKNAILTILDSRTYQLPSQITLPNEGWLVIQAANGQRPVLQTPAAGLAVVTLPPATPGDPDRRAALTLSGVAVEGHLRVTGDLGRLRVLHSTLVPGRRLDDDGKPLALAPSIEVDGGAPGSEINAQLRVEIAFSITGPLAVPEHADGIWVLDSIIDGFSDTGFAIGDAAALGPDLVMERSTVFGRMNVRSLEMSESIATGVIEAVRTQEGCVRFSYVRPGSRTPRRYRCQPELAIQKAIEAALARNPLLGDPDKQRIRAFLQASLVPGFSATAYGRPEYAQLRQSCPLEIRTGAEDGSEMGVFCHLKQPQREGNLRLRLKEYLPFGLEAGILYAT